MIEESERTAAATIQPEAAGASAWIMLALVAATAVLVGFGVWNALDLTDGAAMPEGVVLPADPARQRPATIENAWDVVQARAVEWDTRAALFSVSSQYDYATDEGENPNVPVGGWVVYVFIRGGGDETGTLTILVERNRAAIVRETVARLGIDAPTIELDSLVNATIDSAGALSQAESAAGTVFRGACRQVRHTARITYQAGVDGAAGSWIVSYNDTRVTNGPALRIEVNASSGATTVIPFGGSIPPMTDLPVCND